MILRFLNPKILSVLTLMATGNVPTFAAVSADNTRAFAKFRKSVETLPSLATVKNEIPDEPLNPTPLEPIRYARGIAKFSSYSMKRAGNRMESIRKELCEQTVQVPVYDLSSVDWSKGFYFENGETSCKGVLDKAGAVIANAWMHITLSPDHEGNGDPNVSTIKNFSLMVVARPETTNPSFDFFGWMPGASTRDLALQNLTLTGHGVRVYQEGSSTSPDGVVHEEHVNVSFEFVDEDARL